MTRLKCGVKSCIFNQENNCTRKSIVISGHSALKQRDTHCRNYHKKNKENEDDLSYKMEIGSIGKENFHMKVSCEAINCQFNRNHICRAQEIKIDGKRAKIIDDTFCSSFIK